MYVYSIYDNLLTAVSWELLYHMLYNSLWFFKTGIL